MTNISPLTRREFLRRSAAACGSLWLAAQLPGWANGSASRRPNIVIILADDLGYGDTGFSGATDVPTPYLNALRQESVFCTQAYVTCPQCAPTRAALLTGRYQNRYGFEYNTNPQIEGDRFPDTGLPLDQVTVAERLRQAGYTTGIIGKWHLGNIAKYHPTKRGFDYFAGFVNGGHDYYEAAKPGDYPLERAGSAWTPRTYLTDALGREAADFVGRNQQQPFFLYLSFNAPHTPLQAPAKYLDRISGASGVRKTYAAMIAAMDDAIGMVRSAIARAGLTNDTLIFFLSDNGGPANVVARNAPYSGWKGDLLDGGIHTPLLACWPGQFAPNTTCTVPLIALDLVPTALAAAAAAVPANAGLDGLNLLPLFKGEVPTLERAGLFWRFDLRNHFQWAVRDGDYMLVRSTPSATEVNLEFPDRAALYNIVTDPGQTTDLSAAQPERVAALERKWRTWNAQNQPPAWPFTASQAQSWDY